MTLQVRPLNRALDENTTSRDLKSDHEQANGNNQ